MLEYFKTLAKRVEQLLEHHELPMAAHKALLERPPCDEVSIMDLMNWVSRGELPVTQRDLDSNFGDAALTVANREQFHIQVLYWADASTSIHEHSFSGAFCVLEGSSIHVTYAFDAAPEASVPYFIKGRLRHTKTELLQAGDARPIHPGRGFIHRVFHIQRPTVSVVIRNRFESQRPVQLAYTSALAIDPFRKDAAVTRKLQHLNFFIDSFPHKVRDVLDTMLANASAYESYLILETLIVRDHLREALRPLLAQVEDRHPGESKAIGEALQEHARTINITSRREIVTTESHRIFLALLLTAPTRASLLALLRSLYPVQDPIALFCEWLHELREIRVAKEWGPNSLGIALDGGAIRFLGAVLEGFDVDEAAARASERPEEQAILALTLPRCSILGALFA